MDDQSLSSMDDYFVHQIVEPVRHVGTSDKPIDRRPGFPSDRDSTTLTGAPPNHYHHYWPFNAFKMVCIWQCSPELMHAAGSISHEKAYGLRNATKTAPHIRRALNSPRRMP